MNNRFNIIDDLLTDFVELYALFDHFGDTKVHQLK